MIEYHELLEYCQTNSRICPLPNKWHELWILLKERKLVGNKWNPSLPFILAAWHTTSNELKKERFFEHLKWAKDHSQLDVVEIYFQSLKEEDWFHEWD